MARRDDDRGARARDALAKRRIVAMLVDEIARTTRPNDDDDAMKMKCDAICATHADAFERARTSANDEARRDATRTAGRAIVRACGAAREGFATAEEIAAFATLDDETTEDARRALARGTRGRLRRMHANGETITGGAIAAEEAFEACERNRFWRTEWGEVAERATRRATRAVRRRFGTTARGRRWVDGDGGSSASEENGIERASDGAIDAAVETVDGWLFRERGASDEESELSDSDGGDAPDRANEGAFRSKLREYESERGDFADERGDEDEDGETAFVQVEGAEIRHVEKDAEFVMREILAMQKESERVIAGKIQEKVERTKGAAMSVEARRANMLQSLLSKYTRVDTSKKSHTGAFLRETTSSNPKYHFFRGTEPSKTRIEATNVDVRFRSVDAHVKAKKRAEEDRKERIAAMFRG
jgi:hypothetical protein